MVEVTKNWEPIWCLGKGDFWAENHKFGRQRITGNPGNPPHFLVKAAKPAFIFIFKSSAMQCVQRIPRKIHKETHKPTINAIHFF